MTKPKQPSWSEEFEKVWNKYPMGIIVEEEIKSFISKTIQAEREKWELENDNINKMDNYNAGYDKALSEAIKKLKDEN